MTVEREHRFETGEGTKTVAELFDGRSQLLVCHFMLGPNAEGRNEGDPPENRIRRHDEYDHAAAGTVA